MNYSIGIDLGTTYICVGWIRDDRVNFKEAFPAQLKFEGDQIKYGVAAASGLVKDENYPRYDSKRFIGKYFKELQDFDFSLYPFNIINIDNNPMYECNINGSILHKTPTEISSYLLEFIYKTYSPHISADKGFQIKDVVITVPAYFSTNQRKETREAGEKAGLNVMRLINEPTAAAIAYCYDNLSRKDLNGKRILIYDFGGGTFDVSIIEVSGKDIYVKGTGGDDHLGGQDITNNLLDYCINYIKKEKGKNIKENKKILYKLRNRCEVEKVGSLSQDMDSVIDITIDHDEIEIPISYSIFKELNHMLFEKTIDVVKKTIKQSKMKEEDINMIVLVGGSSKIKYVKELLSKTFQRIEILNDINSEEIVAEGAAYYADSILKNSVDKYIIHDILNHSLGIEVEQKKGRRVMMKLINKGSMLPQHTVYECYNGDYADKAVIRVLEGDEEESCNNIMLGKFEVSLPKKKSGKIKVEISMDVDTDGVLKVTATLDGHETSIKITNL